MFQDIQEQIKSLKNQKLSDYDVIDFILDYMNNHIDSTQKDSVVDRIMDYVLKSPYHKYSTHQLKDAN